MTVEDIKLKRFSAAAAAFIDDNYKNITVEEKIKLLKAFKAGAQAIVNILSGQ